MTDLDYERVSGVSPADDFCKRLIFEHSATEMKNAVSDHSLHKMTVMMLLMIVIRSSRNSRAICPISSGTDGIEPR